MYRKLLNNRCVAEATDIGSDAVTILTPSQVQSQSDLDEQFARNLILEEERQHQHQQQRQSDWENQLGSDPRNPDSHSRGRQQGSQGSQWGSSPSGAGKDTMTEVTEQFNKLAESKAQFNIVLYDLC